MTSTPELCPSPSRRRMLAGTGAVLVAVSAVTTVAAGIEAAHASDAPLFELIRRQKIVDEEGARAWEAFGAVFDQKKTDCLVSYMASDCGYWDRRLDELWEQRDVLDEQIKAYRPQTLAGAVAKMRAYSDRHEEFTDDPDWYGDYFLSALSDLERLASNAGRGES